MVMKYGFFILMVLTLFCCNNKTNIIQAAGAELKGKSKPDKEEVVPQLNDAATILSIREVPVLCYHHINDKKPGDYTVSPKLFAEQLQALADSGYTTILPDVLFDYLTKGTNIPKKSFLLTFDDTDQEQITVGEMEMKKHGFKGVFFIMNIAIGRPRYMSKDQIKQLADEGNIVGAHSWDHHKVTDYTEADWVKQLDEARIKLIAITGKPVVYFAYPFGLWNQAATQVLAQRGVRMAFQLSAKRDTLQPLYSVRRMLVPGTWSTKGLFKAMKATFHL